MAPAKFKGYECDALTRAKRFFRWRAGARKMSKRSYWQRVRSEAKRGAKKEAMRELVR